MQIIVALHTYGAWFVPLFVFWMISVIYLRQRITSLTAFCLGAFLSLLLVIIYCAGAIYLAQAFAGQAAETVLLPAFRLGNDLFGLLTPLFIVLTVALLARWRSKWLKGPLSW